MRLSLFLVAAVASLLPSVVSAQDENSIIKLNSDSLSTKLPSELNECAAPECIASPNQTVYENIHNILSLSLAAHHLHISPLSSYIPLLNDTTVNITAFIPNNEAVVECREEAITLLGCEEKDGKKSKKFKILQQLEKKLKLKGDYESEDCENLLKMRDLDNQVESAVEGVRSGMKNVTTGPLGMYNMFVDPSQYSALKFSPVLKDYIRASLGHQIVPESILVNDLEINTTNIFPTHFNSTKKGLLALSTIVNNTGKFDLLVVHAAGGGSGNESFPDTLYLPYARMGAAENWTAAVTLKDVKSSNGVVQGVDEITPIPFKLKWALKYNHYRGFTALLNYTGLLNLTSAVPDLTVIVPNDDAFRALLPTLPANSEFKSILQSALSEEDRSVQRRDLVGKQLLTIAKTYSAFIDPLTMATKVYEMIAKEFDMRMDSALIKEVKLLTKVAANHLFGGIIYTTDFADGMQLLSMSNKTFTLHMSPSSGRVWKAKTTFSPSNATLTWGDVIMKNGVMHEIDTLLTDKPISELYAVMEKEKELKKKEMRKLESLKFSELKPVEEEKLKEKVVEEKPAIEEEEKEVVIKPAQDEKVVEVKPEEESPVEIEANVSAFELMGEMITESGDRPGRNTKLRDHHRRPHRRGEHHDGRNH